MKISKKQLRFILPIALVVGALGIGNIIVRTTKKPEKKKPQRMAYAVKVFPLKAADQTVRIRATGTVIPAQQITLRSRVAGEVVEVSSEFIEGGSFAKNETLLSIDPMDYELALEQKKAALAEAEYQLKLEEGRRDIAAREWELLDLGAEASDTDRELALRIPHLKSRTAKRDAAEADVQKASLDLERTRLSAPFNAVVVERKANVGTQANTQEPLAVLAGSDTFYVRASIPVEQLKWMVCDPEKGSKVWINRPTGDPRPGRVIRLESSLEEKGRTARILVATQKPLEGKNPLFINEYVRIEIEGRTLNNTYKIPRSALHDDRRVWLATPKGTLEIREVDVAWRDAEEAFISGGLKNGEKLILTSLAAPVNGMKLRMKKGAKAHE